MNRRFFLKCLGLAPFVGLAAKLLSLPSSTTYSEAFTNELDRQGKLDYTAETVDILPMDSHVIQVRHVFDRHGVSLDRAEWFNDDSWNDAALSRARYRSRMAMRRYWAQQIRWHRKALAAKQRVIHG